MERVKQMARGVGKIILVLLGGVLIPILIPVGFGMTLSQRAQEKKLQRKPVPTIGEILATAGIIIQDEAVAAKTLRQQSISEIHDLLARAGLTIHDEATPKKKLQRKPVPTIGEILATAGITVHDEAVAARTLKQQSTSEIHELLARAGLTVHDEPAKQCWEIVQCSPEKREACPTYVRRNVPGWVAVPAKCEHLT